MLTSEDLGEQYKGILCTVFATFFISLWLFQDANEKNKRMFKIIYKSLNVFF